MKTTDIIESKISSLPEGFVFAYSDIVYDEAKKEATIKALNRMVSSGKLGKLVKGKFYKPEVSIFGELQPEQAQVVKDLLESNGKVTGYLTGFSIFSQLGLTTQISNIIQIGRNDIRPMLTRGRYTISFVKQKNVITKNNIPLLQILDSIRYIKKIPDTSLISAVKRLQAIIKQISPKDKQKMVELAMKYPPATRAILGFILDMSEGESIAKALRKSLNPITIYKLGITKQWPTAEKWNIR